MEEQEKEEHVLANVAQQGALVFVKLMRAGTLADLEVAHDIAWEQLHSGPWHEVHSAWRDAFSLCSLGLAKLLQQAGKSHEALKLLDMGIMMGGSLLRPTLNSTIETLQHSLNQTDLQEPIEQTQLAGGLESASQLSPEEIRSHLPEKSLQCRLVKKISLPSLEDFLCYFFLPGLPIVIKDAMTDWPAIERWKQSEYLQKVAGSRTVPVEVGEHYLAAGWKQELMTMSQFLKLMRGPQCNSSARAYLAQHPLFEQVPLLHQDIIIPDYCSLGGGKMHSVNAWFGPAGTVTPLHHDPHHNIFSQVVGRKYVRLYPPAVTECLYSFDEAMLKNSSQVDLDGPDYTKFPLAKDLPFSDCILEEGEMLYIPPKWWHYVKSLSPSCSVSFWWHVDSEGLSDSSVL